MGFFERDFFLIFTDKENTLSRNTKTLKLFAACSIRPHFLMKNTSFFATVETNHVHFLQLFLKTTLILRNFLKVSSRIDSNTKESDDRNGVADIYGKSDSLKIPKFLFLLSLRSANSLAISTLFFLYDCLILSGC